jgi:hypothetical protein
VVLEPSDTSWMPLQHWTDTELAAMAQRFSGRYESWGRDWMTRTDFWEPSPVRASVSPMVSPRLNGAHALLPLHPQQPAVDAGAPRAWLGIPLPFHAARSESVAQLGVRMIFGEAAKGDKGSLAAEIGLAALVNLAKIICAATGLPEAVLDEGDLQSELPKNEFHAWSGCVKVSLPASGNAAIYLNGAVARNLLAVPQGDRASKPVGGLTPLQDAAGKTVVGLNLRLNPVELTFGQLKSLQVGDVVILPHAVEEPLCLVTQSDALLCKAYLGRSDDRRALQVAQRKAAAKPAA